MVAETNLCGSDNFGSAFLRNENSRLDKVHGLGNCNNKKGNGRREMMASKNRNIEITIKISKQAGMTLTEILREVWELEKEHPGVKINVEVSR